MLTIDVVRDGELTYSRAVPTLDPEDEIERTLQMADAPELPILALASPNLPATAHEARTALEFLGDTMSGRLLFTLEPPAKREARRRARRRTKAQRALVATAIAVGLAAYGVGSRARAAKAAARPTGGVSARIARARRDGADAQARLDRAERANRVLEAAFSPAQTMGDAVRALAGTPAEGAWTTGLSVGRVGPLTVSGFARSGADVSKTLDALSADPRFREMRLVATAKAVVGETPVVQFTLTGSPVGTPPFDRPMKKERKTPAKAK